MATQEELKNKQLQPGKIYEFTYEIPYADVTDTEKLQDDLSAIHTNIINSPDFKYISSQLIGNIFKVRLEIKQKPVEGLGVIQFVVAAVIITALAVFGVHWVVKDIKEVSDPVIKTTNSLLPIFIIIGVIWLGSVVIPYIPAPRKR